MSGKQHLADARRRAEEALSRVLANAAAIVRLSWSDGATPSDRANMERIKSAAADIAQDHKILRALLAAGPEAKAPVTTPVPWLECLTVISNPIVPQGAILIHPDTLAGKPDALAYRPPDPLPPPVPITPTHCGGRCEDALDSRSPCPSCAERLAPPPAPEAPILPVCLECSFASGGHVHVNREDGSQAVRYPTAAEWNAAIRQAPPSDAVREAAERLRDRLTPPANVTENGCVFVPAEDLETVLRALRATASPAPGSDAVREAVSENDVYTLIGHAEYLRKVRGEEDMPKFFDGLARRLLASLRGGQKGGE